ncbi:hypothetical protein GE21DRAFT_5329 [Neurospora crassa]|uniref:DUF7707 domain-containing protein n=1 Tax=Neurospora crassa (strain ATCC 24698 / 74-OR23-1A / CBS 708.71 / DSM 1257 / FGSC 987) TaxID=367110 RepID=Q7S063_NEUCR|nr:hypothetical protein NCU04882 [Neurospora crassa OR74A]EAA28687.1 hypothetical protein NCU04882 [Neurospora crassa OR74A]KHE81914.1 hypothetical protein GE21DRAFT_5329 [Neurospora crassa]|eukprot:XP_957923.1 hypothetical protein NCU04882 [Neurospora crassa OR74A]
MFPLLSLLPLLLLPLCIQSYDFSPTLPASAVPDAQKSDWCDSHSSTCVSICGTGMPGTDTDLLGVKVNACSYKTLQYECICNKDNLRPKMELFHYTVPGLMCEAAWKACRKTNEGDKKMVGECDNQIRKKCGHLRTKDQETKNEGLYGFFKPIKGGGKAGGKRRGTFE